MSKFVEILYCMKKLTLLSILSVASITLSCEKKETIVYQQPSNSTTQNIQTNEPNSTNKDDSNNPSSSSTNNQTPAVVKSFLSKYFPNIGIVKNEIKTSPIEGKTYEITLNDGAEFELKENGEWLEVKDIKGIPSQLFPASIKSYLDAHYNNIVVEKIEKERKGYKVGLINDIDLEFDANGKFLRIDR